MTIAALTLRFVSCSTPVEGTTLGLKSVLGGFPIKGDRFHTANIRHHIAFLFPAGERYKSTRSVGSKLLLGRLRGGLDGEPVAAFVFGVAGVPFYPYPLDVMAGAQFQKNFPKISV